MAWQDNNIVLALINIHTVHKIEDFRAKERRRPAKTSTNRRIIGKVFEDEYIKELYIPCWVDDYNQYIGVDLANQFREAYKTYRATLRNWWPLFYWLINVACINEYKLYQIHLTNQPLLTHLQFRTKLY